MMAFYSLLPWVVQATAKGSVAIAIMAAAHALIGRRLRARWWCVLWLIALVRLVAPTAPAAGWRVTRSTPTTAHSARSSLHMSSSAPCTVSSS